jgi:hypothetical protein
LGWLEAERQVTLAQGDQQGDWTNLQYLKCDLEAGHNSAGFQWFRGIRRMP